MDTRRVMSDEEIHDILFNLPESDDEGAEDCLEVVTDNDSGSEYEPLPEDVSELLDDEELVETIKKVEENPEKKSVHPDKPSSSNTPTHKKRKIVRPDESSTQERDTREEDNEPRRINTTPVVSWNESEIIGKNGYIWKTLPHNFKKAQTRAKNVHIAPGTLGEARFAKTPSECFSVFFTEDMYSLVLQNTNREISHFRSLYKDQAKSTTSNVSREELMGLFATLYYAAVMKNNHLTSQYLHNPVYCGDMHRAIMSDARFKFLLRALRFDDRTTREERNTKLAPISDLWEIFISNCKKSYSPGSHLTIGEQLVRFRGRCPFRMYIPNKPNKYGIKIILICDNFTKYMHNAIVYLGKGSNPSNQTAGTYYTLKLTEPLAGSYRNLTMDSWFTSIPLAETLLRDRKITMIGTIRKNKKEFPKDFVNFKFLDRKPGSSAFLFSDVVTAVSYQPTAHKLVTLISTVHDDALVNPSSGKPEIIMNYNTTKGAVDVLDRLCQDTNTGRKTKRWPLAFFYNILNIAAVNAYVVYLHNFFKDRRPGKPPSRFDFIMELVDQLSKPWMSHRLTLRIPKNLRESILRCGVPDQGSVQDQPAETSKTQQPLLTSRTYCTFCHYKKRRKTQTACFDCKKPICGEHSMKICKECKK